MNRFLDITSCLFNPPGWDPKGTEIEMRSNETIEYSTGDIEEHGKVSSRMMSYRSKNITMFSKARLNTDDDESGIKSTRYINSDMQKKDITSNDRIHNDEYDNNDPLNTDKVLKKHNFNKYAMEEPAISLPYIKIHKIMPQDEEYTLVYFHANSEDMVSSLRICRYLSEFYRAKVIIPEYRGYSMLKSYDPDIEIIKRDMRFFLTELSKKGVIDFEKTILFVCMI